VTAFIWPSDGYSGAVNAPRPNRSSASAGTTPNSAPNPGLPPNGTSAVSSPAPSAAAASTLRGPKRSDRWPPGVISNV